LVSSILASFDLTAYQISYRSYLALEVMARIEHEGKPEEGFPGLFEAVMDWRVWWLGVALHLMLSSMSFTIFFPTLSVTTMGYDIVISLLLSAPPWILGVATSFVVARSVLLHRFYV
jgi:hypothetical protein